VTNDAVWETVVHIMRETFDDDSLEVTRATAAKDVAGWDSIANIELLVALQTALGVKLRTGEIAGLKNVGELADTLTARVRAAGR